MGLVINLDIKKSEFSDPPKVAPNFGSPHSGLQ